MPRPKKTPTDTPTHSAPARLRTLPPIDDPDMERLCHSLRQARLVRNLTQESVAETIGVTRDTLRAMEQGKGKLKLASLLALLRHYALLEPVLEALEPRHDARGIELLLERERRSRASGGR